MENKLEAGNIISYGGLEWIVLDVEQEADVFLLSVEEYKKYKNVIPNIDKWWWLRTPGRYQNYAASVNTFGSVERRGDYVDIDTHAVRPALWLKREAVQNRK